MKYLKLFDSNSNDFYESIPNNLGHLMYVDKSCHNLLDEYFKKLENICKSQGIEYRYEIDTKNHKSPYKDESYFNIQNKLSKYDDLYIYELDDNWWLIESFANHVTVDPYYYKCDQFEGLIYFLKDYGVIE